jgi:hypothetical protein
VSVTHRDEKDNRNGEEDGLTVQRKKRGQPVFWGHFQREISSLMMRNELLALRWTSGNRCPSHVQCGQCSYDEGVGKNGYGLWTKERRA